VPSTRCAILAGSTLMQDWLVEKSQALQGEVVTFEANYGRQKTDESNFSKIWQGKRLKASKIDKIVQRFRALIL
jgi:hypothetical protein